MKSFSITDVGKKRTVNQDYVFNKENELGGLPNLYVVADGMGGHNAGDFASRFCVETIINRISEGLFRTPIGILEDAIKNANDLLLEKSIEQKDMDGMGTTLVVATVYDATMYVANMGDSRLYVINDQIKQVTMDHSLVEEMVKSGEIKKEEARFHPNKNVITRAIGTKHYVSPDYYEVSVKENDVILLCSDGLTNMIEDEEILGIVKRFSENLEECGKQLVETANAYGGKDNIAIVLFRI